MDYNEFYNDMKKKLKELEIDFNNNQGELMYKFMNLVCQWNEKINLTAITEPREFILKHLVDSLVVLKYLKQDARVLDLGTGAGFPGIPLNIMRNDDIEYTLVDSLNKRILFLSEVTHRLNLSNISLIHSRVEDLANTSNYRENYDIVVSRAVAPLNVLAEYMLPFVKIGGICLCMKGSNIEEELSISRKAIDTLGGKILDIEKVKLPDSDIERNIIIVEKVKETDNKYPRKAGIPRKSPII